MIRYSHFALNNLFLANGYREEQTSDGIQREYEHEDELEQCIRRIVLRKSEPLRGWDLRFLRRGLELSQADFGRMLDRDAQTIARWEKSNESVPKSADLMIRVRFAERFEPQITLAELLSFVDGTAPALPTFIQLSLTEKGWKFDFELRTVLPSAKIRTINWADLPLGYGPVQIVSEKMLYLNASHFIPDSNPFITPDSTLVNYYQNEPNRMTALENASVYLPELIEQPLRTLQ